MIRLIGVPSDNQFENYVIIRRITESRVRVKLVIGGSSAPVLLLLVTRVRVSECVRKRSTADWEGVCQPQNARLLKRESRIGTDS